MNRSFMRVSSGGCPSRLKSNFLSARRWSIARLTLLSISLALVPSGRALGEDAPAAKNSGSAVTEDPSGILRGDFTAIRKPTKDLALTVKGAIREIRTTADSKRLLIHEWIEKEEGEISRVSVQDLASGKVTLLQEWPDAADQPMLHPAADGRSVVLLSPEEGVADRFDLETGKRTRRYDAPKGQTIGFPQFSSDGKRMAAASDARVAVDWDLETGTIRETPLGFVPRETQFVVMPFSARKTLLVVTAPATEEDKAGLFLVEPEGGEPIPLTQVGGNFDVRLDVTGKTLFIFRQKDPTRIVWTGIELWDVDTGKLRRTVPLRPRVSSIGLEFTQSGRHLFLHQYLSQQIAVWDLERGKVVAVVGPELGGFRTFCITPDGSKLIGIYGNWVQGSLQANKIGVFDTAPAVQ
jgi:WD40 repeat protein